MGSKPSIPVVVLPRNTVVIVTGASSGIGYETAKYIAMMGAKVVLACRSEQKANEAMRKMDAEFQEEKRLNAPNIIRDDHLSVEFMKLDLSSLESTMKFIETFKAKYDRLNLLICNAGVYNKNKVMTEDNFDLTYQVNYLGHFLIVAHLIPILMKSGKDCRIVFVCSEAHQKAKYDVMLAEQGKSIPYDAESIYNNTKLFQIMQMYCVDKILLHSDVEVCCVNPGVVDTELFRNHLPEGEPGIRRFCMNCCGTIKTPHTGCATTVYAAVNPDLIGISRGYYKHSRAAPSWPSKAGRDSEYQMFLWSSTRELLKKYIPSDIDKLLDITVETNNKQQS
ncbi:WW domain-containing oxidoreductase-like [Crassostrea virginica]